MILNVLYPCLLSTDDDRAGGVMDNVVTDATHDRPPDFAEAARSYDD